MMQDEQLIAHLAAVVESSDDAIISKSLQGIIQTWNRGAERIFGYTASEVIGKPITILIPPERQDEEPQILARLRRGERVDHFETIRVRKDGTLLNISLSISPIKNSAGEIIGASKIARDITPQKRLEAARSQSETRLHAVVAASPECVKIVDPDGLLQFMNAAGLQMIQAPDFTAVAHRSVYGLIAPEHRERWILNHSRVCAGERVEWEFEIIGLNGERRWMETHAVPVPLEDGRTGQLAVTRDISSRKRLDEERESLLTRERNARAEAERISFMKDEFLATLSHELRTPINAIMGWTYLLRQRNLEDPEVNEALEVIDRNTRVQVQLIDDLLDMSRIIAGKVRLNVQAVDLDDVVRAAIASVRHAADAKNIRIQALLDPLSDPIRGDPARLQQCFWNILSNAIKFTPKNGKIQVHLHRVDSRVEVSVADNGVGIKPDFLPHIFERFRQADSSTTRSHSGLGLGLSIVKNLVELHGGKVRAMSPGEGQGTTITVELPLPILQTTSLIPPRNSPAESHDPPPVHDHPSLAGIRVLVVDDEADARSLVRRLLEGCSAQVADFPTAAEALSAVQQNPPDIILSDIGMPGTDGYEFIRRVRTLPVDRGGRTPAAALTAFARAEDRTRALRAGFQTHVAKPVEPSELVAVVASLALRR
jgi:PAS domain S-box-containing protein